MSSTRFRITLFWTGISASGFLIGAILAVILFATPPVDSMEPQALRNQYDVREAAFSLSVGMPFAVSQWLGLRYLFTLYDLSRREQSIVWIPVTGIGIAAMMFLMPSGLPMLFLPYLAKPMLPAIAALGLTQWLVLRWLIRAGVAWLFVMAIGGTAAVYLAEMGGLVAGPIGWGLVFGATIGIMQGPLLARALEQAWRRRCLSKTHHPQ
jgi:hypothetical protein